MSSDGTTARISGFPPSEACGTPQPRRSDRTEADDHSDFFRKNKAQLQQAAVFRPSPNPTFENPQFAGAGFRALIVRLSPFRDVERSLPHLLLADAVRRAAPDAYVDMCFFPPFHDRRLLEKEGVPLIVGIQSFRPMEAFDLVLISNSYTLELVNLPYMLLHSGIPLEAGLRDGKFPPIIVGGSNAMAAQALIGEDGGSPADGIFFGEGEHGVETIVRVIRGAADAGKRERMRLASESVEGLWVVGMGLDRTVSKSVLREPRGASLPTRYPILNGAEAGTARLQIAYGCPAFCAFCFEGFDRRPYREVPLAELLEQARNLKRTQGCRTIDLYGFNVCSHAEFPRLLLELNRLFDTVGMKSQRVDTLSELPDLLQAEVAAGKRSFTLGIEGISARQRACLNKSLTADAIDGVLRNLLALKIREIKLFFILTGNEDNDDMAEFRGFCGRVKSMRERNDPDVRLIFSFGLLVRMPGAPMRYQRLLLEQEDWSHITDGVKAACGDSGLEFRLATPWADYCMSQVMALGGYWLRDALLELAAEGCCYDTGLDVRWWTRLRDWMRAHGHWNEEFLGEKEADYRFSLSFVRNSTPDGFLRRQYLESVQCRDTGYCFGNAARPGNCLDCGACPDAARKKTIVRHSPEMPRDRTWLGELQKDTNAKRRLQPRFAVFELPAAVRGTEPEWLNAFAMSRILHDLPGQVGNLLSVEEQLFTNGDNLVRFGALPGKTVLALKAWENDALLRALAELADGRRGDLMWVSAAEGFRPGVFASAHIRLAMKSERFPGRDRRLHEFLRAARVRFSTRKAKRGHWLEVHGKQGGLLGCAYWLDGDSFVAQLEVNSKFDLKGLLRSLGDEGGNADISVLVQEVA